jgi:hypothetical protein
MYIHMMVIHIIIQIIISLFVIFIIHSFYNYLKDTYSSKKTKDLVTFQVQKYQEIIQEMQNNQFNNNDVMKNELTELVRTQEVQLL